MELFRNYERANFGYEVLTTIDVDFEMAEIFAISEEGRKKKIEDTYKKYLESFKSNYKYLTELVIFLNFKCWEHYEKGNNDLCILYSSLYHAASRYATRNLKDEEFEYFYKLTD